MEMNVCTQAPQFNDDKNVIAECAVIKDKQSCLDSGKCMFTDCLNTGDNSEMTKTTTGMIPAPELPCPNVAQQCVQFNGQKTPGTCLNVNDPAVPVSYAKNSCTHKSFASKYMVFTNRCGAPEMQNQKACENEVVCQWNGDKVDCQNPNTPMPTHMCGVPAGTAVTGTANYPSTTGTSATANYPASATNPAGTAAPSTTAVPTMPHFWNT
jgi:hypothetical protein